MLIRCRGRRDSPFLVTHTHPPSSTIPMFLLWRISFWVYDCAVGRQYAPFRSSATCPVRSFLPFGTVNNPLFAVWIMTTFAARAPLFSAPYFDRDRWMDRWIPNPSHITTACCRTSSYARCRSSVIPHRVDYSGSFIMPCHAKFFFFFFEHHMYHGVRAPLLLALVLSASSQKAIS